MLLQMSYLVSFCQKSAKIWSSFRKIPYFKLLRGMAEPRVENFTFFISLNPSRTSTPIYQKYENTKYKEQIMYSLCLVK